MSIKWPNYYETVRGDNNNMSTTPFCLPPQRNFPPPSMLPGGIPELTPFSIWPHGQQCQDDMVWRDPNSKPKKTQDDKGTNIWGDPTNQAEIKRWKETIEESSSPTFIPMNTTPDSRWALPPTTVSAMGGTQTANRQTTAPLGWGHTPTSQQQNANIVDKHTPAQQQQRFFTPSAPSTTSHNTPESVAVPPPLLREPQNRDSVDVLTQQIADQLRVAVSKGLINIAILNQPLPQHTLVLLNQLLQRVSKVTLILHSEKIETVVFRLPMEAVVEAEDRLRQQHVGGAYNEDQKQRLAQLDSDVYQLQQEIKALQDRICNSAITDGRGDMPMTDRFQETKSKLAQWSLGAVTAATGTSLTDDVPWKRNAAVVSSDEGVVWSSSQGGGVREFVPGQRWEWRDPQLAAKDPHATPASLRLPPPFNASRSHTSDCSGANDTKQMNDLQQMHSQWTYGVRN